MKNTGIVYLMKTVIRGVYKIGISNEENFENRMRHLENNGYANVGGLERILAIKTDNYKDKEALLHDIFGKSRIGDTELFAIDENLVKRLYLSLRGEVIFPKNENAEDEIRKTSNKIQEEKMEEISRSIFVEFVRGSHHKNPSVLRDLIGEKPEFNLKKTKVRIFREEFFGKSGTKLTSEIDDGIHIYTTFSKSDLAKAMEDYSKLFGEKL